MVSKVCFVNTSESWGGGEKWHATAARYLSTRVEVVVATKPSSKLHQRMTEYGLPVFPIRIGNLSALNPWKIWKIVRFFRQQGVQTVVLNLPADVKAAGIAAKIAGVKRIIYRRGMPKPVKDTIVNRYLFAQVVTQVIVNSKEIGRTLIAYNQRMVDEKKVYVVYNGVDVSAHEKAKLALNSERNDSVVRLGTAGRLVESKNHALLIGVVERILKSGRSVSLEIAGAGPLEPGLRELVNSRGLQDSVKLSGFVSDPAAFMARLDIFVFPSKYEGSANAIVEAMASALPVVAFDVSSMPEMVEHEITGLLAKYESEDDFTAKVVALVDDKRLRQKLGAAALARAKRDFDSQKNLKVAADLILGST